MKRYFSYEYLAREKIRFNGLTLDEIVDGMIRVVWDGETPSQELKAAVGNLVATQAAMNETSRFPLSKAEDRPKDGTDSEGSEG